MLVNISGNRCIGCAKFTQYYSVGWDGGFQRIDCGFCGQRQCTTRPGSRCRHYRERSNVAAMQKIGRADRPGL